MAWQLVLYTLQIFQVLILVRVVLSWVASPASRNPWVEMLRRVTDPVLRPIQAVLPSTGMVDLSPLVALLLIGLLQRVVAGMAAASLY